ncbi:MAG: MoaD/ThiS family protein [Chloroflexota bacterium]|nr:MoaD/ThiS family protein [Chloroflexota bacterium]
MNIEVEVFGSQQAFLSPIKKGLLLEVEVEKGTRVTDILDRFRVAPNSRKRTKVNKMVLSHDHVLKGGDRVSIFSPVLAGGG